uniref:Fringe-like glycosyltransferase domain-containing protein n=1 Tax=Strigops habroptila TaxID=2489341 RepID=A0A672TQ73_STRHB
MGRRLIHGLSGAAVFLVSVALLSMRHLHPLEEYRTEGSLTLEDIFIAVKTTKRFHQSRMELLLDTWISRAREQVRCPHCVWAPFAPGWCDAAGRRVRQEDLEDLLECRRSACSPVQLPSTPAQAMPSFLGQIPSRASSRSDVGVHLIFFIYLILF